jgi:hypothetical protein
MDQGIKQRAHPMETEMFQCLYVHVQCNVHKPYVRCALKFSESHLFQNALHGKSSIPCDERLNGLVQARHGQMIVIQTCTGHIGDLVEQADARGYQRAFRQE